MSLVNTIRKTLVPIHPEGHKFIVAFFAVSLILGFLWMPLFWVGMVFTAWCAYFFRDPERSVPQDDDYAISPADGTVSISTAQLGYLLEGIDWRNPQQTWRPTAAG